MFIFILLLFSLKYYLSLIMYFFFESGDSDKSMILSNFLENISFDSLFENYKIKILSLFSWLDS